MVRVAAHLGLDNPTRSTLLHLAAQRWPGWQTQTPALADCPDVFELPAYVTARARVSAADADAILQALAWHASRAHGDDLAAATVLAWLLLPGAARVAASFATASHRSDEIVAAQLWIEARSWNGGHKVAANTLMNVRRGVARDLGIELDRRRVPVTVVPHDPQDLDAAPDLRAVQDDTETAVQELRVVLAEAVRDEVISAHQQQVLESLARCATQRGVGRGRGAQGVLAEAGLVEVGTQMGMSRSTVRRRAANGLASLRAYVQTHPDRFSA